MKRDHSWLQRESAEWGIPRGAVVATALAPLVLVVGGLVAAAAGSTVYTWVAGNDGALEKLQVVALLTALVGALALVRRLVGRGEFAPALIYALLVVAMIAVVGEEVAWGRDFYGPASPSPSVGLEVPRAFHNRPAVDDFIDWSVWAIAGLGAFLPLVPLRKAGFRWRGPVRRLIPPVACAGLFLVMFAWRCFDNVSDGPESLQWLLDPYDEVAELSFDLGLAVSVLFQVRRIGVE